MDFIKSHFLKNPYFNMDIIHDTGFCLLFGLFWSKKMHFKAKIVFFSLLSFFVRTLECRNSNFALVFPMKTWKNTLKSSKIARTFITARSIKTVENSHSFLNVPYTWYKSLPVPWVLIELAIWRMLMVFKCLFWLPLSTKIWWFKL